jgi:hypothetical protein
MPNTGTKTKTKKIGQVDDFLDIGYDQYGQPFPARVRIYSDEHLKIDYLFASRRSTFFLNKCKERLIQSSQVWHQLSLTMLDDLLKITQEKK